jgi:signal transduction histidine kinase
VKDHLAEFSLLMAQRLAVAQLYAGYLHEQSHGISHLSVLVSTLLHEAGNSQKFKNLAKSIGDTLDGLHEQNRSFQRLLHIEPERIEPLQDIIESTEVLLLRYIEPRRVHLKVNIAPEVSRTGVLSSTRAVVTNLLMNALAAAPPRGRIWLEADLRGPALEISVTDSGPGVPVSLRERIWEPFVTTSDRSLGLGLFVCREWAKKVGALISLDSSHAPGARFVVTIPLRD